MLEIKPLRKRNAFVFRINSDFVYKIVSDSQDKMYVHNMYAIRLCTWTHIKVVRITVALILMPWLLIYFSISTKKWYPLIYNSNKNRLWSLRNCCSSSVIISYIIINNYVKQFSFLSLHKHCARKHIIIKKRLNILPFWESIW